MHNANLIFCPCGRYPIAPKSYPNKRPLIFTLFRYRTIPRSLSRAPTRTRKSSSYSHPIAQKRCAHIHATSVAIDRIIRSKNRIITIPRVLHLQKPISAIRSSNHDPLDILLCSKSNSLFLFAKINTRAKIASRIGYRNARLLFVLTSNDYGGAHPNYVLRKNAHVWRYSQKYEKILPLLCPQLLRTYVIIILTEKAAASVKVLLQKDAVFQNAQKNKRFSKPSKITAKDALSYRLCTTIVGIR